MADYDEIEGDGTNNSPAPRPDDSKYQHSREFEKDMESSRSKEKDSEKRRDRDRERNRDGGRSRDKDRDRERGRSKDRDRERERDHEKDRDRHSSRHRERSERRERERTRERDDDDSHRSRGHERRRDYGREERHRRRSRSRSRGRSERRSRSRSRSKSKRISGFDMAPPASALLPAAAAGVAASAVGDLMEMKTRSQCGTPNTKSPKLKTIFLQPKGRCQTIFLQPKRCCQRRRRTSSDLPFEIQLNIISRLSVKLIFACKSLSKTFKASISEPSFTRIYHDNYYSSSSVSPIFINSSTMSSIPIDRFKDIDLELVEFQRDAYFNDNPIVSKCKSFSLATLPGSRIGDRRYGGCSIWGQCNGLFCLLKCDSPIINLFLTNPLSGEFIKLPNPIVNVYDTNKWSEFMMAYGLGYCQTTERYKVLRMVTKYLGGGVTNYNNETEILTIGVDKNWRSVLDVNIPFNVYGSYGCNPQSHMVAFRSALHWIVLPIAMHDIIMIEPKCGGIMHIAAFNLTEEKVYALPIPSKAHNPYRLEMGVLMDKLCLWNSKIDKDEEGIDIWIMDEYGVEGTWAKQFTLMVSRLPHDFLQFRFMVISISVHDQVILVSNGYRWVFYDLKTNYSLMCINLVNDYHQYPSYLMPFVPNFFSFRNLHGWTADLV